MLYVLFEQSDSLSNSASEFEESEIVTTTFVLSALLETLLFIFDFLPALPVFFLSSKFFAPVVPLLECSDLGCEILLVRLKEFFLFHQIGSETLEQCVFAQSPFIFLQCPSCPIRVDLKNRGL